MISINSFIPMDTKKYSKNFSRWIALVFRNFFFALAIVHEVIAAFFWMGNSSMVDFLLVHGGSSVFVLLSLHGTKLQKKYYTAWLFFTLIWTIFPIVGPIVVLITVSLLMADIRSGFDHIDFYKEYLAEDEIHLQKMFNQVVLENYKTMHARKVSYRTTDDSFAEILSGSDKSKKKIAINRLRLIADQTAITLLKRAQEDDDYDIKYLATIALTSIEQNMMDSLKRMENDLIGNESDLQLRNELIKSYLVLFEQEMLDRRISKQYLKVAIDHAVISLQLNENQSEIYVQLAKIHIICAEYAKAKSAIENATNLDSENVGIIFLKMKILYLLGEYSALKKLAKKIKDMEGITEFMQPPISYWSQVDA